MPPIHLWPSVESVSSVCPKFDFKKRAKWYFIHAKQALHGLQNGISSAKQALHDLQNGISSAKQALHGLQNGISSAKQALYDLQNGISSAKQALHGLQNGISSAKRHFARFGSYFPACREGVKPLAILPF